MRDAAPPDGTNGPWLGQTISHYRVLHCLDSGGMGDIYAARDIDLGRTVALKFLPPELSADADAVERFRVEARALSTLNHPHICTIHEFGQVGGRSDQPPHHFIAMELLEGTNLEHRIDGAPLPIDLVVEFGMQIAGGLEAAHAKGIIHRDVKPANIFVIGSRHIKILDFGLAKVVPRPSSATRTALEPLTLPGAVLGTTAYMSPEQVLGEELDTRTDLFSCGAVLYEMATGQRPFAGQTSTKLCDAILHSTPIPVVRLNPLVPPDLERIIAKALEKTRETRYQTAADLEADLKRLQRGSHVSSRQSAWHRRRPVRTWLGATAATATVLALSLGIWFDQPKRPVEPVTVGATGRPAIAVLPFDLSRGDARIGWLSRGVPVMLVTTLAQTPGLDVISSQRLDEVLGEINDRDMPDARNRSRLLELIRRTGAGALVDGSIFSVGPEIRIDAHVQEVTTGRIVASHSVRGTDVFQIADDLTGRIRGSLNLAAGEDSRGIAQVTSSSVEAYRLYTEGLEARRNLRETDARKPLQKAVAIDPTFAAAYFELADVCSRLGDETAAEAARRDGRRHMNRLPQRKRLLWQADDARRQGRFEEAVELLESLVARYPDEEDAYLQMTIIFAREFADDTRALASAERGVKAVPYSFALRNDYGYRLLALGRYPEAIREFKIYAQLRPDEPNPHDSLAEAYLVSGNPEHALKQYTRALELNPSFAHAHTGRIWALGTMGRYDDAFVELDRLAIASAAQQYPPADLQFLAAFTVSRVGQYRKAAQHLAAGLRQAAALKDAGSVTAFNLLSAAIAIERGQFAEGRRSAAAAEASLRHIHDASLRRVREVYTRSLQGIVNARTGHLDAARTELATLDALRAPDSAREAWAAQLLRGEIALASGDPAAAERAFTLGEPPVKMWFSMGELNATVLANGLSLRDGLARAKTAQGDLTSAIDQYHRLLTVDVSQKWTSMLEPRYVLELARLIERTGHTAEATREYRRFLDLWRTADPASPEATEATAAISAAGTGSRR